MEGDLIHALDPAQRFGVVEDHEMAVNEHGAERLRLGARDASLVKLVAKVLTPHKPPTSSASLPSASIIMTPYVATGNTEVAGVLLRAR